MRRPALSIRWKMTLVYTGLLAGLLAAFGVFLYTEVGQLMIGSVNAGLTPRFEQILRAVPTITAELADRSSLGGSHPTGCATSWCAASAAESECTERYRGCWKTLCIPD
jgi:hypothetical protein